MKALFKHELKSNMKGFLIWTLSIGVLGFICILLYASMEDSIGEIAESFSNMGAFSDAFGMSTLSMATMKGYFATEIGTIHGLGGAMFAASIAAVMLSKEEDGHTSEFLFTLPVSRGKVIVVKMTALATILIAFNVICGLIYQLGCVIMDDALPGDELFEYMALQTLMHLVIAAICLVLSAYSRKNKLGVGIGIVLLLYMYDKMARVIPDLKDYVGVGPFAFCEASEVFTQKFRNGSLIWNLIIMMICIVVSYSVYKRRDLSC